MRLVKPERKRPKSDQGAVLRLTSAIRTAAAEVVRAYDAFDLQALEKDDLDVVFLRFATPDGLEQADDLVHRLPGVVPCTSAQLCPTLRRPDLLCWIE
jgi:hypothetical protein